MHRWFGTPQKADDKKREGMKNQTRGEGVAGEKEKIWPFGECIPGEIKKKLCIRLGGSEVGRRGLAVSLGRTRMHVDEHAGQGIKKKKDVGGGGGSAGGGRG